MKDNDKVDTNLDAIEIGAGEDADSLGYDQDVSDAQNNLFLEGLGVELKERINQAIRDNSIHKWRKIGLVALFSLVVIWLLIICVFLLFAGYTDPTITIRFPFIVYGWLPKTFYFEKPPILQLSDPVIIALIGSTTVNVVGLFLVAARWLYGNQKADKDK